MSVAICTREGDTGMTGLWQKGSPGPRTAKDPGIEAYGYVDEAYRTALLDCDGYRFSIPTLIRASPRC